MTKDERLLVACVGGLIGASLFWLLVAMVWS